MFIAQFSGIFCICSLLQNEIGRSNELDCRNKALKWNQSDNIRERAGSNHPWGGKRVTPQLRGLLRISQLQQCNFMHFAVY